MGQVKIWLEIVYFLSGPAVAIIAYFALAQIRIAKTQLEEQKKALKITSKRDALRLTAEQVTLYCDKIIPLQNTLDAKLKTEGIDFLEKFEIEFQPESIRVIPLNEDIKSPDFSKFGKEFVDVANAMESFSTYFATGVADERVAYLSLGSTFCNSMKRYAPILIPFSNDGRRFSATLRLYSIWGVRLESENLEKQKAEIDKKLRSKKQVSTRVVGEDA